MRIRTITLLCSTTGMAVLAMSSQASDYILLNNLDVPNSTGVNSVWGVGSTSTVGQYIGDDPGNTSNPATVPTTAATSGYAVSPFSLASTLQGSQTSATIDEVQIVMNLQAPTMSSLLTGNVYGAFYKPSANNSLSSATLVGGFFQFTPGTGNGTIQELTANITNMPVLTAGQNYWLVIAPKAGLNAQNTDTLTHYGIWTENSQSALDKVGVSNSTNYGTISTEMFEQAGARTGDTLTGYNAFFGTRIYAVSAAGVPETSTWVTALLGLIPAGLLMRRRRSAQG